MHDSCDHGLRPQTRFCWLARVDFNLLTKTILRAFPGLEILSILTGRTKCSRSSDTLEMISANSSAGVGLGSTIARRFATMCKAYYAEDGLQNSTASSWQPSRRAQTCAILAHPLRPADRNVVRRDLSRLHIGAAERKVAGGFLTCMLLSHERSPAVGRGHSEPAGRDSAMISALLSNVPPEYSR